LARCTARTGPVLAVLGLVLAPFAAPAVAGGMDAPLATTMAPDDGTAMAGMDCCPPKEPVMPDCMKACPLLTLCLAKTFPGLPATGSLQAALAQADVELRKTVVRAGVGGRVEQFTLRVGDIVNPFMRPAGVLIPEGAGRKAVTVGFGQIEAQVMKVGMVAEVTCISKPWTVIPMVVTQVQDFIAAGRGGLPDAADPGRIELRHELRTHAGTAMVFRLPIRLALMVISAIIPFVYFKRKGWL
jgi:hypothetical protein